MTLSNKDIYNILKEFNEYGAAIYYALEEKRIKLDDITAVLFKDTTEKMNLVFPKFIERIQLEDIDLAKEKYKGEFTRLSCIDLATEANKERLQHLRDIRDIVCLENDLVKMIKEKNFQHAFNLYFTGKILDKIASCTKRSYISIQDMIRKYQNAYQLLLEESTKRIVTNIDNYYISKITN